MTTNERLLEALKKFPYPCTPDLNEPDEEEVKKYFTFNIIDEHGADFGDNEPGAIKQDMQLHFFLPIGENSIKEKRQVREAVFAAGFTYPKVTELREKKLKHIIFEFEAVEERED